MSRLEQTGIIEMFPIQNLAGIVFTILIDTIINMPEGEDDYPIIPIVSYRIRRYVLKPR